MRIFEIVEARKNPEKNIKISVNRAIMDRISSSPKLADGTPNCFVSFTNVEKLGVNPQSPYDTPLGIYSYPAEYIIFTTGTEGSMWELPFAGSATWANIFNARGNIVFLDKGTNFYRNYVEPCSRALSSATGQDLYVCENIVRDHWDTALSKAKINSDAGHFWYVTMKLAEAIAKSKNIKTPTAWNWVFRSCGIDGIVDPGQAIIHEGEPTQAVFFSIGGIGNVSRIANRYSPTEFSIAKYRGNEISKNYNDIKQQVESAESVQQLLDIIRTYGENAINLVKSPGMRQELVKKRPVLIRYINRPTAADQQAAIDACDGEIESALYGLDARYMDIPTIAAALENLPAWSYPNSLKYITDELLSKSLWSKLTQLYSSLDLHDYTVNQIPTTEKYRNVHKWINYAKRAKNEGS